MNRWLVIVAIVPGLAVTTKADDDHKYPTWDEAQAKLTAYYHVLACLEEMQDLLKNMTFEDRSWYAVCKDRFIRMCADWHIDIGQPPNPKLAKWRGAMWLLTMEAMMDKDSARWLRIHVQEDRFFNLGLLTFPDTLDQDHADLARDFQNYFEYIDTFPWKVHPDLYEIREGLKRDGRVPSKFGNKS